MLLLRKYLPYFMWLLPLLFFAYQFILRLWPGLMMNQIMEQFNIDASHFGILAAFYYYGYAGMQIPVAMMLDRFGARKIIFIFALLCGAATLMFTVTTNFYLAVASRFLIGVGSAVGFLGVSKVLSEWFPKDQYAKMVGFSFTFGLMGAVYGGKPISLLIETYSSWNVSIALGIASIMIGLGSYLALKTPKKTHILHEEQQFKMINFISVLSSPIIWYLALANLLMVGLLEGFADVWGVGYLMKLYGLNKADAAELTSFIFVGMIFGGPLLAFFSKKFGNYSVIATCGFAMAAAFVVLLLGQISNYFMLSCLFFAIGITCCYQVIIFAAGSGLVSPKQLGFTIAFLNCMNMLGGSFFHTIIGKLVDLFWDGTINNEGLRIYSLEDYKYALSIIPICAMVGGLIVIWISNRVKN